MALFRTAPNEMSKPAPAAPAKKDPAGPDKFPRRTAIGLGILFALLSVPRFSLFRSLDAKWSDQLFRWRGPEAVDAKVVLVTIDDESIQKIGQYPWPRSKYKPLIEKLMAAGAKVVAFDVMFVDPSFPEQDKALVDATRRFSDRIVHSAKVELDEKNKKYLIRRPFAALEKVTKHVGVVDQLQIDGDGSVRVTYMMYGHDPWEREDWLVDPERVPSLGVAALSLFEGKPADLYAHDRTNQAYLNVRGQSDAEDETGITKTKFSIPRVPIWRVVQGQLSDNQKALIKGGIVLIGSTAVGAFDHYPSPFSEQQAGVEVHATVIDNILNNRLMKEPSWGLCAILCLGFAFLSAWAAGLAPLVAAGILAAVLGLWILASFLLLKSLNLVFFWGPALSLAVTFVALFLRKTLSEQQEKRFIKQTFGQFVAPEVVDKLVADPSQLKLGGEKRDMTVFFLDIAHFTTISEKMDPESLIIFLNKYLSALSKVVHDHKGVVDKYIGDCIMAFWNAPLDDNEHRIN
ncbi:MAG: adenylate/guanylate cyclase domain-containing protein, partial [Elusimicrobia bacterium]|nr:adenylate/guanylate cyclase domain-containing protein [Elusimicrobiota bacterium]